MISNWSKEANARFNAQIQAEGALAYHYACLLSAILWPAGNILDWFTSRDFFYELSLIRWSTGFLFLLLYFFSRSKSVQTYPYAYTFFIVILGSFSITLMCLQLGGYQSHYYAGINAIVIALGLLLPYGTRQTIALVATVLLTYWIPISIYEGFRFDRLDSLVNNHFFLTLSAVLVIAAAARRTELKRALFERHLSLEEANQRLQHYDRLRSDFFSNISHEFRTPLTLILSALDRLHSVRSDDESYGVVRLIRSNALILLRHVNDLLDLSKLEMGKMKLSLQNIDLSEFVGRLASLFQIVAEERKIQFVVETPDQLIAAVDVEKFERLVLNLLSNAFKFLGSGRWIRISIRVEGDKILLEVEDDGPGIPHELREMVFERFYQADAGDSRSFGGTGLGLSIVREFVSLHQGRVTIVTPQSGTLFRVELPLTRLDGEVKSGELSPGAIYKPAEVELDLLRVEQENADLKNGLLSHSAIETNFDVLIVEDHSQMRSFLVEEVSKHFSTVGASSPTEAFAVLSNRNPGLIVSDLMMPQMSGAEFFEALQKSERNKNIPFMFLTAKADEEMRLKLLKLGAVDYLIKPFSPKELLAKIQNYLSIVRTKQILQKELNSKQSNLELLTGEIIDQKQKLELAIQSSDEARDDAIEAGRIKSKFLGFISHELKNPLVAVRMTARTLLDKNDEISDIARKALLSKLVKAADSLQSIIETLLDYTRIRKGKFLPKISEFVLLELVQSIVQEVGAISQSKGLDLQVLIPDDLAVESDRELLGRIVSNLLSNALKYTSEGSVRILSSVDSRYFEISVEDTGVGFEASSIEKIFEEFERLPGPQSFVPGIGLGLALVKVLVSSLHGTISVVSEPKKGSRFTVRFPKKWEH